ncbi:MAG: PHP domain-containing protein [Proteobacteria bacterium]|nr:PHP domain-containing protein [Pseudomonadota bacterium]MBU1060477.1 PHP domain-containing protein [Pseudomonadota bacterium]
MSIDLHTHSHYSDGTKSPTELVRLAASSGVSALSLTDHDTMGGVEEAVLVGIEYGVEVVPGLELSVVHKQKSLHILGYWMDPEHGELSAALTVLQRARDQRNGKIITKLQALGIDASAHELAEISGVGQTGRPHIAKLLMAHGVVRSMQQAFDEYLKKDARAYVDRFAYSAEEAIGLIVRAGGIAVLAHPVQVDKTLNSLPALLAVLKDFGLEGIETFYPTQSKKMRKKIRQLADVFDLVLTGGSDYHGDIRPGTRLAGGNNVFVPPGLLDKMKARLQQRLYPSRV